MINPKDENKLKRQEKKRKGRYGMIVNEGGRAWAFLLRAVQEKRRKGVRDKHSSKD